MESRTWNVQIVISNAEDAVYASAVLVDGPATVTGQGRAVASGDSVCRQRDEAVAARRALSDVVQAMRLTLERDPRLYADRISATADPWVS